MKISALPAEVQQLHSTSDVEAIPEGPGPRTGSQQKVQITEI